MSIDFVAGNILIVPNKLFIKIKYICDEVKTDDSMLLKYLYLYINYILPHLSISISYCIHKIIS